MTKEKEQALECAVENLALLLFGKKDKTSKAIAKKRILTTLKKLKSV